MRVGLIGCGSIGTIIAEAIRDGDVPGAQLACIADVEDSRHGRVLAESCGCPFVQEVRRLTEFQPEVVVEAASREAIRQHLTFFLSAGVDVMLMSVGALLDGNLLESALEAARQTGARILVSSGAIGGLDVVKAVAADPECRVSLTTRKAPAALRAAAARLEPPITLDGIDRTVLLYEGPAGDAARWFPENLNVAAVLSLVGVGAQRTVVRVYADPDTPRTVHEIEVSSSIGRFTFRLENVPNPRNPKSSLLAAYSAIAKLRSVAGSLSLGT
jgi:aspartate dehydrogenase